MGGGSGRLAIPQPEVFTWRTSEERTAKLILFCYGNPEASKTYVRYESSQFPVECHAKNQHSSLVIETLPNEIDGSGVAVAYVYSDFSIQNMQSAITVLGSVLSSDPRWAMEGV